MSDPTSGSGLQKPGRRLGQVQQVAMAEVAELEEALARGEAAMDRRLAWLHDQFENTPPPGMALRHGRA